MLFEGSAVLAIALMALATYATRAGGLWLASRLPVSGRTEAWLGYIPGAILVSLVAPVVVSGGLAEALAALAVVIVAIKTGNLLASMLTGVAAIVILRSLMESLA
ncbi:MAG: AzlD domain-containing protein [Actinomycetota bacterium]|nr:AzlD domain-containing protein [Actinomycetota bacterium]